MRNLLSTLALAALVGVLPGTSLAQRKTRRPAPRPDNTLRRIDQRLDRLERSLRSLASSIGRLNKLNAARDARVRKLEAALRRMAAERRRPVPSHKAPPRKPPVKKVHHRRPPKPQAARPGPRGPRKLSPEQMKKIRARIEAVKKAMKRMPPERRKAMEARLRAWKARFNAAHKPQVRKPAPKPKRSPRLAIMGGKISPEVMKRVRERLEEAKKKMSPERRKRLEAFLKKLRERREAREHGKKGKEKARPRITVLRGKSASKGWSPIRIRVEGKKKEARHEGFQRFQAKAFPFSPERIREFVKKHPQVLRFIRRMHAFRSRGGRTGPWTPGMRMKSFHRRPGMEGRTRGGRPGMFFRRRARMGRRPMPFAPRRGCMGPRRHEMAPSFGPRAPWMGRRGPSPRGFHRPMKAGKPFPGKIRVFTRSFPGKIRAKAPRAPKGHYEVHGRKAPKKAPKVHHKMHHPKDRKGRRGERRERPSPHRHGRLV